MKLALRRPSRPMDHRVTSVWTSCQPFMENSRGVLIHRPMQVVTYKIHPEPHMAVHYWCGNCVSGGKTFTFLDRVPDGRLLCEVCDARARMAGLPTAAEICGRHVHIGKVIAQQTCCGVLKGEKS